MEQNRLAQGRGALPHTSQVGLKLHSHVCQGVYRCLRKVVGLIIAHSIPHIGVAVALAAIERIEEVIDTQSEAHRTLIAQRKIVAQIEVCDTISIQRQYLRFIIGEVLSAYIAGTQLSLKALYMEIKSE